MYRSFILKLRRPKTGLEIGFSSLFLASMKDMIDGPLPAKIRNKLSRGRHVLVVLIFFRTPLEKHDSYKKYGRNLIISTHKTTSRSRASLSHSLHIHS